MSQTLCRRVRARRSAPGPYRPASGGTGVDRCQEVALGRGVACGTAGLARGAPPGIGAAGHGAPRLAAGPDSAPVGPAAHRPLTAGFAHPHTDTHTHPLAGPGAPCLPAVPLAG